MPAPAVYILAIVGTIAAGLAFKEVSPVIMLSKVSRLYCNILAQFVYEPHIAPKIEQWAEDFVAKRQARRRQRASAIPVAASQHNLTDENISRRRAKRSDSGDEADQERRSIELENLIGKEVREWRSEVNRSQSQKLRHRNNAAASSSRNVLDEASSFYRSSSLHTP